MDTDRRSRFGLARELMAGFARDTGLVGPTPPRRYLWTDAFAVCNFLGFHRATGEGADLDLALRLVDQVHHVLGRHRSDDLRQGWISGLSDRDGELHPTAGGLRIGKPLPERRGDEPFDDRLEWDRDGQYLHYLTQWIHALARVGEETGLPTFRRWAIELAGAAHDAFVRRDATGSPRRMAWKMSIALDRELVSSMGQHDPLDLWLAAVELDDAARSAGEAPALAATIATAEHLATGGRLETDDPLGLGALLLAAYRLARLAGRPGHPGGIDHDLLPRVARAARSSLEAFRRRPPFDLPAEARLAFRELGLAIGLHAIEAFGDPSHLPPPVRDDFTAIARHAGMARAIDEFWSAPATRRSRTWQAHRDIDTVMLATSLEPRGYLGV